jgi:hydroxymethylbilane synthase
LCDGSLGLRGLVGWPDGTGVIRDELSGPVDAAADLGRQLAERLLAAGARPILDALLAGH